MKRTQFVALGIIIGLLGVVAYTNRSPLLSLLGIETNSVPKSFGQFLPKEYTPLELKQRIENGDDIIVVDARRKDEYDKGHVPGAIHVDYNNIEELQKLDKSKEVIVYCTLSTWRAPYAAYNLHKSQHPNIALMTGGVSYWQSTVGQLASAENPNAGVVVPKPKDLVPDSPTDLTTVRPPMREFTTSDLAYYDGKENRPSYVALDGNIYDVSESPVWINGEHRPAIFDGYIAVKAGSDLTDWMRFAPHGKSNIEKFPVVGTLKK